MSEVGVFYRITDLLVKSEIKEIDEMCVVGVCQSICTRTSSSYLVRTSNERHCFVTNELASVIIAILPCITHCCACLATCSYSCLACFETSEWAASVLLFVCAVQSMLILLSFKVYSSCPAEGGGSNVKKEKKKHQKKSSSIDHRRCHGEQEQKKKSDGLTLLGIEPRLSAPQAEVLTTIR
jgi:hypothetical protein